VQCQSTICALPKNSPPDCFYLASLGTVAFKSLVLQMQRFSKEASRIEKSTHLSVSAFGGGQGI
ncbi:MAG: hypothetical protein IIY54_03665, partial [Ruminococcus sp.]|nr:hypothetical protein [Ruminococcus sp.]